MESNTLHEINKQKCCLEIFLQVILQWFDGKLESVTLWIDLSGNSSESFKNLLNFWSDRIEKQSIMNLSSYSSKSYASVVLSDSEVTFTREDGI